MLLSELVCISMLAWCQLLLCTDLCDIPNTLDFIWHPAIVGRADVCRVRALHIHASMAWCKHKRPVSEEGTAGCCSAS